MKFLQDLTSLLFILVVEVLALVSVLGIWEIFTDDTIEKSLMTLGLLAFVSAIVMIAARFIENRSHDAAAAPDVPNPIFKSIRQVTLIVLIVLASLLALVGVLAIWEIIPDREVLFKTMGSLAIFAFAAFVIVLTCLMREKTGALGNRGTGFSIGGVILSLFLLY